jgi:UDP-glucose 4-epimerase
MATRTLVTGGAGYIGSHIVRELARAGRELVILDDLSQGHRAAVRGMALIEGDFGDRALLDRLLREHEVEWVIHMAALCEVGQSMREPGAYYDNNLTRSLTLLDAMRAHGVRGLVFSSTAAVYGEPEELPITEDHPQRPTNPYGETKLAFERALRWYHEAYGVPFVALRYFNAAGAHPDGDIGEDHAEESHLIPRLLRAAQSNDEPTPIHGTDYPTRDGSCVRDYVHVVDLAQAHLLALAALEQGAVSGSACNLGNGSGFTVLEVVEMVQRVTGRRPATRVAGRRPGDPPALVASAARAAKELGWKPSYPTLESIVRTAWDWHRHHPRGYEDR